MTQQTNLEIITHSHNKFSCNLTQTRTWTRSVCSSQLWISCRSTKVPMILKWNWLIGDAVSTKPNWCVRYIELYYTTLHYITSHYSQILSSDTLRGAIGSSHGYRVEFPRLVNRLPISSLLSPVFDLITCAFIYLSREMITRLCLKLEFAIIPGLSWHHQ